MGQIEPIYIEDEMRQSYINYAMSVIRGRAIPDIRDGLKPVQRRILYGMHELGLQPNRPHKKSARIVGEVMGKYHPHGDQAVYDTLAHMAQDFSFRYPLIDGQGNFGSIDGDAPAAMRYCVTGDTLIATHKGLVPIAELAEPERGVDQKVHIQVLSKDRQVQRAGRWFDCGEHPTLRVRTRSGYELTGTYNHPVLTWSRAPDGRPSFQWKTLDRLRLGDHLVLDRTSDLLWPKEPVDLRGCHPEVSPNARREVHPLPQRLDEDLASLLGALVAEGTMTFERLEFTGTPGAFADRFRTTWERVFPTCRLHVLERPPVGYGHKPFLQMQVVARQIVQFFHRLGLEPGRSREWALPPPILRSPKRVVAAFLRAYFEGDGAVERCGRSLLRVSAHSASEPFLRQLQVLLLRFGIASRLRADREKTLRLLIAGRENLRRFAAEIGLPSPEQRQALQEALSPSSERALPRTEFVRTHAQQARGWSAEVGTRRRQALAPERLAISSPVPTDYLFEPVVRIEPAGLRRVYSLRVESACHSFWGNGFLNHNTEARLAPISQELLAEIDEETVDFVPNFDESLEEPLVLPAKIPNLLLNGSWGISVGMTTQIPPHNLAEVIDALCHLIAHPEASLEEIMAFIQGPDFPTGGVILGREGLVQAYRTGRGKLRVRGVAEIEDDRIVIREIPFQVRKTTLVEAIASKVKSGLIGEITDLRDETAREGIRIVIELKRGTPPQVVLNKLYKYTPLEWTFGANFLVIDEGKPRRLNLVQLLRSFLAFRRETVRRRTAHRLAQAEARAHLLEGLLRALEHRQAIIDLIAQERDPQEAKLKLQEAFAFSEAQAEAILQIRLRQFTGLEGEKLRDEHEEKRRLIAEYRQVLEDPAVLDRLLLQELKEIRDRYADPRRTQISLDGQAIGEIDLEALIPEADVIVGVTDQGYVNAPREEVFRTQQRGGRGVIAIRLREKDALRHVFKANTHDHLLVFTDAHKAYKIRGYQLPSLRRDARGENLRSLIAMAPQEKVCALLPLPAERSERCYCTTITRQGIVNRNRLQDYLNAHTRGILAVNAGPDDFTVQVRLTQGRGDLLLVSEQGQVIRFPEAQVRCTARPSKGVRGMRLNRGDGLVSFVELAPDDPEDKLLLVTRKGYGKRTPLGEFSAQRRGGKGVLGIKIDAKTGPVVAAVKVKDEDELMVTTRQGKIIRFRVSGVRVVSRYAKGVRVIDLEAGDEVASVVRWEL